MTPYTTQGFSDKVVVGQPQINSFQGYSDAAHEQSRRYLDPQQDAANKAFEQDMVNKGIAPGSDAYKTALSNMQMGQNDANTAAAFGAMQYGSDMQNQMYNQSLGASQLANAMAQSQLSADTSTQNAQLAADTSRYGIDQSAATAAAALGQDARQFQDSLALQQDTLGFQQQQWSDQFGLEQDQFGFAQDQWGDQFGLQQDQFGFAQDQWSDQFGLQQDQFGLAQDQFGFQQQQGDFGNLMQLGNFGINYGNYLNNAAMTDYNMAAAMLGNAPGNQQQQINVGGAYNTAQQGALGQAQLQQQAQQNMWGGLGDLAGAGLMAGSLMSGVAYKTVKGQVSKPRRAQIVATMLNMPIYEWRYLPEFEEKGAIPERWGPLAEDFNRGLHPNDKRSKEIDMIDVQRYMASMHLVMQDLSMEVRRIEGLLWFVANRSKIPLRPALHANGKAPKGQDVDQGRRSHDAAILRHRHTNQWLNEGEIMARQGTAVVKQEEVA